MFFFFFFCFFLENDEKQLSPTAVHNMSVMSDMVMLNNFKSVEEAFGSDNSQLKDGILLLKIWLHQRQLSEVSSCYNESK